MGLDVAKIPKSEAKMYGERKLPRQFVLTETASEMIDTMADQDGCSRSELVERLVREKHDLRRQQP